MSKKWLLLYLLNAIKKIKSILLVKIDSKIYDDKYKK